MNKKLKVVNMCSNQILVQGITKLLVSREEINYEYGQLKSKEILKKAEQADVVIMEDTCLTDAVVQASFGMAFGTFIYISLDRNEVTLVSRKQFNLENVQDLYDLIKGSSKLIEPHSNDNKAVGR